MNLQELYTKAGVSTPMPWADQVEVAKDARSYQLANLKYLTDNLPACADYSDPGTGKTLTMQALILWMVGYENKVVAVMPPVLVKQFQQSFLYMFQGVDAHVSIAAYIGNIAQRQKLITKWQTEGWPDVLIMSYSMFSGTLSVPKNKLQEAYRYIYMDDNVVTPENFGANVLLAKDYTAIVCDEAHALKNPNSGVSGEVRKFAKLFDSAGRNGLVLATGSPIETNVEDAFGLISLVTPSAYPSVRSFEYYHCIKNVQSKFGQVVAYKNIEMLNRNLYAKAVRVTKREAFKDMPPRVVSERLIDLSPSHQSLYKKLCDERLLLLEDTLIDATNQSALYQAMQKILVNPNAFTDTKIRENVVLDAVDALLDEIGNRKVILFCWYQESVEMLREHYKSSNPAVINGSVSGTARDKQKQKFISDPSCRLLVANPRSGGVGIDGFQHVCSYTIFVEVCPWVGAFEQAIGRVERSGQTETVNVYIIVPRKTIAVKLRNDLVKGELNANSVVQDTKTLMHDLMGADGIQGEIK